MAWLISEIFGTYQECFVLNISVDFVFINYVQKVKCFLINPLLATVGGLCNDAVHSITVTRCWSAFLQSSWTDCRPSSTQQLVRSGMLWQQITLHLCWKTYTGCESRKGSSTSYVSLRSSVNIVWHHPTCLTNFNKSLKWSPDSVWDNRVCQCSSYHLLEGRQSSLNDRAFLAVWLSGNALASINVVALRQTRLVSGWVTVCGRVNHLGM